MLHVVGEFLLPRHCLLCGKLLLAEIAVKDGIAVPLCPRCLDLLETPSDPRCSTCSQPLISEDRLCMRCRTRSYPFRMNFSLYSYDGPIKAMLHQYKFQNQRVLAHLFAALLAPHLRQAFPGDPIVPVPARPANRRKRGWDHVGVIAEILHSRYGCRVVPLLQRSGGAAQKSLDFEHRTTNLRGRIRFNRRLTSEKARPKRIVLLDDIFTTGATAGECSRVLLEHGVQEVAVMTIAVD